MTYFGKFTKFSWTWQFSITYSQQMVKLGRCPCLYAMEHEFLINGLIRFLKIRDQALFIFTCTEQVQVMVKIQNFWVFITIGHETWLSMFNVSIIMSLYLSQSLQSSLISPQWAPLKGLDNLASSNNDFSLQGNRAGRIYYSMWAIYRLISMRSFLVI